MSKFDPTLNYYPLRRRRERVWIDIKAPHPYAHLDIIDMPKMIRDAYHQIGISYQRNTFWGRTIKRPQFDQVFFVGDRYYLRIQILSVGKKGERYSELPEGWKVSDLIETSVLDSISQIIKLPVRCIQNENGTWLIVDVDLPADCPADLIDDVV